MAERDYIFLGCYSGNHDWRHIGGCNAGCDDYYVCSVPVNECAKCGDCDYGQNPDADEIRERCSGERIDA